MCFEGASALNPIEKSMLYYIYGCVAFKEGIVCSDDIGQASLPPVPQFTVKLSHGKLKLPPLNPYDICQYYYAFFESKES